MQPISTIEGDVSVLARDDVDTDQIIPKQFLKRVERTGFGEFLFYDWAKEPGWDLPKNPILVAGPQLRLRLLARARPVGARGLRLPLGDRPVVRRHLQVQLDEDRAAAGRRSARRSAARSRRPASATVDLEAQEVRYGDGQVARFDIDPQIKHRLLHGLDDVAMTLNMSEAIDFYEHERERPGPVTTSL